MILNLKIHFQSCLVREVELESMTDHGFLVATISIFVLNILYKQKGNENMKHTFELKLPKIFGKKKGDSKSEIKTEVEMGEVMEEAVNAVPAKVLIGGLLVVGLTVGYL